MRLFAKFMKVYSSEIIQENSSARVYSDESIESTPLENFPPFNFPISSQLIIC